MDCKFGVEGIEMLVRINCFKVKEYLFYYLVMSCI